MEKDSEILNYFCFPEYGYAVALRHGDILLFNPLVEHCDSSKRVDHDVFCCSLYVKSKLVGGNNNTEELTMDQKEFLEKFGNI